MKEEVVSKDNAYRFSRRGNRLWFWFLFLIFLFLFRFVMAGTVKSSPKDASLRWEQNEIHYRPCFIYNVRRANTCNQPTVHWTAARKSTTAVGGTELERWHNNRSPVSHRAGLFFQNAWKRQDFFVFFFFCCCLVVVFFLSLLTKKYNI